MPAPHGRRGRRTASSSIANDGDAAVDAVVSVIGAALTPEPAVEKGFKIERSYYTLDGKKVDLPSAAGGTGQPCSQNDRLVVVVKVEATEKGGRVLLVDRLPAGLEIENPRLVDSGDLKSLDWLKTTAKPEHTEFRDDRFVAAFNFSGQARAAAAAATTTTTTRAKGPMRQRHRRLHGARRDARQLRASGRDRGGHVPPRALRPHRRRPAEVTAK